MPTVLKENENWWFSKGEFLKIGTGIIMRMVIEFCSSEMTEISDNIMSLAKLYIAL